MGIKLKFNYLQNNQYVLTQMHQLVQKLCESVCSVPATVKRRGRVSGY